MGFVFLFLMCRQQRPTRGLALFQKSLRTKFSPVAGANIAVTLLKLRRYEEALDTVLTSICKLAHTTCGFPETTGDYRTNCDCTSWGVHSALASSLMSHKASILFAQDNHDDAIATLTQSVNVIERVRALHVRYLNYNNVHFRQ